MKPAWLPMMTEAVFSAGEGPVWQIILTETSYSTSVQGVSPMCILPRTSSSFKPKLLPSIVTNVPPSIGPLKGFI